MIRYKNHEDDWSKDNELGKKCFEGDTPLRRHPSNPLQIRGIFTNFCLQNDHLT